MQRSCAALAFVAACLAAVPAHSWATTPATIGPVLDGAFASVNTYWQQTEAAAGRPAPSARHVWVPPGAHVNTACGVQADDNSAFYCATDDTIYISETFASGLSNGTLTNLPGEQAGFGRAAGVVAVDYVVAHEYGHNIQQETGTLVGHARALPTELNADCLAGTWAAWAYKRGQLTSSDLQQMLAAAAAVGDFEMLSPQHHGTPEERRDAVQTGIRAGSPSGCASYLQQ